MAVKKPLLTALLLAFLAVSAEAQVYVEYQRRTRQSSLRVVFRGGYDGGYGYAFPGRHGTFYFHPFGYRLVGHDGFLSGVGGPGIIWYEGPAYPLWAAGPFVESPARSLLSGGSREPSPALASDRQIEEGRRRFRSGDYRGAVEAFRGAVTADPEAPVPKAWFALALVVVGESRNADKALRAAAEHPSFAGIELGGAFRDERERDRLLGLLSEAAEEGSLAAAWVLFLQGRPGPLRALAEKDPVAKRLTDSPSTGGARRPS